MKRAIVAGLLCGLMMCSPMLSQAAPTSTQGWTVENVDPGLEEFLQKLYDQNYFKTSPEFTKVIYYTAENGLARFADTHYSVDNLLSMHHLLRRCSGGKLESVLAVEPDAYAKALGFADMSELKSFWTYESQNTLVSTVDVHAYIKDLKPDKVRSNSGVTLRQSAKKCELSVPGSVCRLLEYDGAKYWFVAPTFVDYSYSGDLMFLYTKGGEYRCDVDLLTLFSGRTDGIDATKFDGVQSQLPIYVIPENQLCKWSDKDFTAFATSVKNDKKIDISKHYTPEFTTENVAKCAALFDEYIGYVPAELEAKLDSSVELVDTTRYDSYCYERYSTDTSMLSVSEVGNVLVSFDYAPVAYVDVDSMRYAVIVPTMFDDAVINDGTLTVTLFNDVQGECSLFTSARSAHERGVGWIYTADIKDLSDTADAIVISENKLIGLSESQFDKLTDYVNEQAFIVSAME